MKTGLLLLLNHTAWTVIFSGLIWINAKIYGKQLVLSFSFRDEYLWRKHAKFESMFPIHPIPKHEVWRMYNNALFNHFKSVINSLFVVCLSSFLLPKFISLTLTSHQSHLQLLLEGKEVFLEKIIKRDIEQNKTDESNRKKTHRLTSGSLNTQVSV